MSKLIFNEYLSRCAFRTQHVGNKNDKNKTHHTNTNKGKELIELALRERKEKSSAQNTREMD